MSGKNKATLSTFGGWNIWGLALVLMLLACAGLAKGQEVPSDPHAVIEEALQVQLLGCIANERAQWSVIGTADFVGEPWVYKDIVTVPGEQLVVHFDDQTLFSYGEVLDGTSHDIWASNLHALKALGMDNMPPPYTAIKRSDDAIFLLKAGADGSCDVAWFLGYF